MRHLFLQSVLVLCVLALSAQARAQLNSVGFGVSDAEPTVPGHTVIDVVINFTGQLSGVALLTELTAGGFFLDPGGNMYPPDPVVPGPSPSDVYTFLTLGDARPSVVGGSGPLLGGATAATFSSSLIDVAYTPPGGVTIADQSRFMIARLVVVDDIAGTVSIGGSANGVVSSLGTFDLATIVPEPGTVAVITLGLLPWSCRRLTRARAC